MGKSGVNDLQKTDIGSSSEPDPDCDICPRLVDFRLRYRASDPDWFNAPVPSFGDRKAQLLIVGLAPGLKGANKTGRPFTGDYAGDLLYSTLSDFGYAHGTYDARPDDGLTLRNCLISNAVRCVPPENKPIGAEIKNCRPYLQNLLAEMTNVKVIMALGSIAHNSVIASFHERQAAHKFAHNAQHKMPDGITLIDSYHCSRYNTNTGRLTTEMFHDVFRSIDEVLGR